MINSTDQGPQNLIVCGTKRKIDKGKTNQDFSIHQNASKQLKKTLKQKFESNNYEGNMFKCDLCHENFKASGNLK